MLFGILRYIWKSSSKLLLYKTSVNTKRSENLEKTDIICQDLMNRMASHKIRHTGQTSSGDPLILKQKEHHRRAFEFISKALKIDEENEGYFIL